MTAHTNGLLATFEVGDNGNLAIGSEDKTSLLTIVDEDGIDFASLYHAADARRIVACWNLLDGYATEELEGVTLAEFVAKHPELAEKALIAAYASIFVERGDDFKVAHATSPCSRISSAPMTEWYFSHRSG